jgi:sulfur carrier protein ThiS adenylyltransferase
MISVTINEVTETLESGTTLHEARRRFKPDADVLIRNGFPARRDIRLEDGDAVVFIRRGEIPAPDEMAALLAARSGPGVHAALRGARVGIAGLGGLGSAVAVALARTGVGELLLVDFDVVEPSNLNRQQYFVDQIGRPKVDALAENLRRIHPYVRLHWKNVRVKRDNVADLFRGCQVLAECFDDPDTKRDFLVSVRETLPHVPLVTVSGIAGYGPADTIRTRRIFENVFLVGDLVSEAAPGSGLLAPRVAVAAGQQANVIVRILLGEEEIASSGGADRG